MKSKSVYPSEYITRTTSTPKKDKDGNEVVDSNGNVVMEVKHYYKARGAVIKIYRILYK